MKSSWLVPVVVISLGLACELPAAGDRNPEQSAEAAAEGIVFQDDFSNGSGNWDLAANDQSRLWIEDELFRISIDVPDVLVWSAAGQDFEDVRVEVDAEKLDGPDGAEYGIVCRYAPDEAGAFNFYYFVIAGNGYAAISKVQGSEQSGVSRRDLRFEEINPGNAANHISAACIGNQLTLYVNHSEILVVADDAFASGDVGLIATTYDEGGMQVRFDNFVVKAR